MTSSEHMDVRKQVQLSFRKSLGFCLKGISYRLFRSSLTLAVVVVAVAFFMALLSEGTMTRSIGKGVAAAVLDLREGDLLLTHIFYPHSTLGLSRKLAAAHGQPETLAEFAQVAGITPEAAARLAGQCRLENKYLSFFEDMNIGKRMVLVKKARGREVFTILADPARWDEFTRNLANMRSLRLPTDITTMRAFVDNWPNHLKSLEAARAGWAATVTGLQTRLQALTGGGDVADWIAGARDAEVEQWRQAVVAAGFRLEPVVMLRLRHLLTLASHETRIARLLQSDESRKAWKESFGSLPSLEEQFAQVNDPRADSLLGGSFTPQQRVAVAANFTRAQQLRNLEDKLPVRRTSGGEPAGFLDGSQLFLAVISFIVCMVGITNAMLMSITERFREIATMKCLGATDGFILNQFLIEAAIQGMIGGTLGMAIGLLVALIKSSAIFGVSVFVYFPALPLLLCAVFTVVLGVLLSMLASIYPSRAAAAMAPMDAMRVE